MSPEDRALVAYDLRNHPEAEHTLAAVTKPISTPAPTALLTAALAQDPAVFGKWSANASWPTQAIHAVQLPTGKILIFTYDETINNVNLWDPVTNQFSKPASFQGYLYCTGHATLADGRVLLTGGLSGKVNGVPLGPRDAVIYDPFKDSWTVTPDMNGGRYYPTNTTLPSGNVLVVAGAKQDGTPNGTPQVFRPSTNTWRTLSDIRLGMPLYPMMFVAPNGSVYNVGPLQSTRFFNTDGTGSVVLGPRRIFGERGAGTAVMYDAGKILIVGGGDTPRNTAEVIDLNAGAPAWRAVDSLDTARRNINSTVLPDGEVLITGGTSGPGANNERTPVYTPEMWNPVTEQFRPMAPMAVPRWYHSTALLLPDGRVLSAGGNGKISAEIYSPAYLFKGARPTISAAPVHVGYGEAFTLSTPDSANITSAVMIRMGSATHSFNFDQRLVKVNFTKQSGGLTVTSPVNGNVAPPGFYMMFVLNAQGVPSVARVIRVDPTAPPTLEAENTTLAGGTVRATTNTGFSGTGYADFGGTGSSMSFNVTRDTAGTATLTLRYANGGTTNRPLSLLVNGTVLTSQAFTTTGSWTTWATVSVEVSLNAGNNTIKLSAVTPAGPNLDWVRVV